jgi:hypothetical protein
MPAQKSQQSPAVVTNSMMVIDVGRRNYEESETPVGPPAKHVLNQVSEFGYWDFKGSDDAGDDPVFQAADPFKQMLYCFLNLYQLRSLDTANAVFTCKLRLYFYCAFDWSKVTDGDIYVQRAREQGAYYSLSESEVHRLEKEVDLSASHVKIFNALTVEPDGLPGIRAYGTKGGAMMWNIGLVASMKETYDLHQFPFDVQKLTIELRQNNPKTWDDYELSVVGVQFHKTGIQDLEWNITTPTIKKADHKQTNVFLYAKRKSGYYLVNVFGISCILSLMSLTIFTVPVDIVADRLSLVLTLLLTTVAFKFVVGDSVPKVPYATYLDSYMLWNIAFLFLISIIITCAAIVERNSELTSLPDGIDINVISILIASATLLALNSVFGVRIFLLSRKFATPPIVLEENRNWYCFMFANPSFIPDPERGS